MRWHECQDKGTATVMVTDSGLVFMDEYEHNINYCPYCGKPEGEIVDAD